MAAGDGGPHDAMVKIELMTCQLGALDDSDKWMASMDGVDGWRRWVASMVGFDGCRRWVASMGGVDGWRRWLASMGGVDGWLRWVASMVGVDGGLGSSTQRALTWKSLCVTSAEGGTHTVACSLSEQFTGCPVAFVPVSRW